ncbi:NAC domain-containing protein 83 [Sesamum angolense]|uniref:NAC domain-containing protein 83 n=1 Tax=Sesamum angolense TaxID=2727404 RepID=A0AAE1XG32_9LAMI|nr:NAC domain-containing protein 83 [Sesamum angolense]
MENYLNVAGDGGRKLPPGFRFQPTDEEIVFQYLARKTFSHPLPPLLIPEIDVSTFDPWELPGNFDQDKYFFSNKEGNARRNGDRISRGTCSGHWKATGSTKRIICSKRMPIVGIRKSLVFYKGKSPRACRTDWIMHEYFIALSGNMDCDMQQKKNSQGSLVRIGNWSLCRVFLKKSSSSTAEEEVEENYDDYNNPRKYDHFMTGADDVTSDTDSCSASSSSTSSPPHSHSTTHEVSSSS